MSQSVLDSTITAAVSKHGLEMTAIRECVRRRTRPFYEGMNVIISDEVLDTRIRSVMRNLIRYNVKLPCTDKETDSMDDEGISPFYFSPRKRIEESDTIDDCNMSESEIPERFGGNKVEDPFKRCRATRERQSELQSGLNYENVNN